MVSNSVSNSASDSVSKLLHGFEILISEIIKFGKHGKDSRNGSASSDAGPFLDTNHQQQQPANLDRSKILDRFK